MGGETQAGPQKSRGMEEELSYTAISSGHSPVTSLPQEVNRNIRIPAVPVKRTNHIQFL